jgi:hypothetical protein
MTIAEFIEKLQTIRQDQQVRFIKIEAEDGSVSYIANSLSKEVAFTGKGEKKAL